MIKADSAKVVVPSHSLCFAMIDGNHEPKYVENDFRLVWSRISSEGVVAFHDYEGDLPQTTAKINEIIKAHQSEIKELYQNKKKWLLFITKK